MKAGCWDTLLALRDLAEAIPIISENQLPFLTENNFQPPFLFGPPRLLLIRFNVGRLENTHTDARVSVVSTFTHIQNPLYPWHIQNIEIFKIPAVFRFLSDILQCLWKLVFARSSFLDHFRCLAGFSIRLCIYKCYLACTVILGSISCIFRHIQALFKSILTYIEHFVYPCEIQIPGIFRLQGIFIMLC